ncbi:MAG: 8-oxo-dGTP diphosphatase MutT [Gammaproteobacteria bacterium]|nr:8-oxo-dGTP diphosphatase MutT [Gammaproteobacteria bacterium]
MTASLKVVAAILCRNGKVLVAKRPEHKHQGGKWEFPGGKVEPYEENLAALKRECLEEIGIHIQKANLFHSVSFNYPDQSVAIDFYLIDEFSGTASGLEEQEVKWVDLSSLNDLTFPAANQPVVDMLLAKQPI